MRHWCASQKEIQDRRNFCQEVIAYHRDALRSAALVAAKRRMQRNNGVKAWHGAHSLSTFSTTPSCPIFTAPFIAATYQDVSLINKDGTGCAPTWWTPGPDSAAPTFKGGTTYGDVVIPHC